MDRDEVKAQLLLCVEQLDRLVQDFIVAGWENPWTVTDGNGGLILAPLVTAKANALAALVGLGVE